MTTTARTLSDRTRAQVLALNAALGGAQDARRRALALLADADDLTPGEHVWLAQLVGALGQALEAGASLARLTSLAVQQDLAAARSAGHLTEET